ncbi:MAG: nucleotidyltransferase domain-containing protein [candidate division NC10 bacterium]|nr:nucleotidyltransferase domain-containing protein [candidate division NC10 bacterium]
MTVHTAQRPFEVAKEVAKLARAILGGGTRVVWFGSWVRGAAAARSDLDIAVSIGTPIPPEVMAELRGAVEELPTLYKIDLMDFSAAGSALRAEVVSNGMTL